MRSFYVELAEETETFLHIVETKSDKLVTVVELLNPSNKVFGPGRDSYEQKQSERLAV